MYIIYMIYRHQKTGEGASIILRKMSINSLFKKMILERFNEHLLFFKFRYDFKVLMHFAMLNLQTLRIFTPF